MQRRSVINYATFQDNLSVPSSRGKLSNKNTGKHLGNQLYMELRRG